MHAGPLNNRSVIKTQRAFRTRFVLARNASVPDRKTILKSPGRPRTVRAPENVEAVRASIQQSPRRSARKHAKSLGISSRSLRRILHADLKLHPYKMVLAQELSEVVYANRRALSAGILQRVPAAAVLSSGEVHFHISGAVNKQNFRCWAKHNPRELHEGPLHSPCLTVWCAVAHFGVIGPYFFEEGGATVTVTSERYIEMLETFLRPKLDDVDTEHVWFQQDRATDHTARRSLGVLREMFPGRLISLRGDVGWPARSPDLSPCDFFLWGYLKEKEIDRILPEITRRVRENFRERLQQCIVNNGHHLFDKVFKTH
uniref:Transposase n=1 Tax=Varanus komodoensis TaxID=61221 RepID=A0A8D2J2S7_VARKO